MHYSFAPTGSKAVKSKLAKVRIQLPKRQAEHLVREQVIYHRSANSKCNSSNMLVCQVVNLMEP